LKFICFHEKSHLRVAFLMGQTLCCAFQESAVPRPILDVERIHPAVQGKVAGFQQAIVQEVQAAVATHLVVVVGMAINPFPGKARRALDAAGVAHHYLEYGSYLSKWRERSALKMWTGWPTFPMVFVKGVLVGGAADVDKLLASGELKRILASPNFGQKSMDLPNPFRIKYREVLVEAVGQVVRGRRPVIAALRGLNLPEEDFSEFRHLLEQELAALGVFNCARFRLGMHDVQSWIDDGRPQTPE